MERTNCRPLTIAITMAIATGALTACGGGSNTRPTPPPPAPAPAPPPAPAPAPPPAPETYTPGPDNTLVTIGADQAHEEGYTGKGVKIAIIDNFFNVDEATYADRVAMAGDFNALYEDGKPGDLSDQNPDDYTDFPHHGTLSAEVAAGSPYQKNDVDIQGGVAPKATLYLGQAGIVSPGEDDDGNPVIDHADGADNIWSNGSGAAIAAFRDEGVRIFSNSYGDVKDSLDDIYTYNNKTYQATVAKDGLLVWAAGNESQDHPAGYSLMPILQPDLEKGWLAVVSLPPYGQDEVEVGTYKPDELADYSNQCGDAADWCLAAPGTVNVLDVYSSKHNDHRKVEMFNGTSAATPAVAGAAALVAQAYPWMTMAQVRATLLTTATDLGDEGVDEVFGWGLLNVGKAVHGPGKLVYAPNWGVGTFNVKGHKATFSNDIDGDGALVMDGSKHGKLTLSGKDTYEGGTTVKGATLNLTGSVASDVTVEGGTFTGTGAVKANLVNEAGMVRTPRTNSDKRLTITGDYTAKADATTAIALGNPLDVGGTATLDGTLAILPGTDDYKPEATETLIDAGKVKDTFADTDASALTLYTAKVNYHDDRVTAKVKRKDVSDASAEAQSVPVRATGKGIENALEQADTWSRTGNRKHPAFMKAAAQFLAAPSHAAAMASIDSLSGEAHGTMDAAEITTSGIVDHAVALRQHGTLPGEHMAVWTQGYTADFGMSQAGYASARANGHGELLGVDVPVVAALKGGLFMGHGRMNTDLDGLAGRVKERDDVGGIYATWHFKDGTYVGGRASYTRARLQLQRTALLGMSTAQLATDRKDTVSRVTLEAGHRFGAFTPYLAATGIRVDQGAFTEQGAGGFGLTAKRQHHDTKLATLGVRWHRQFGWVGGQTTLTGYGAWVHVLSGASTDYRAALAGTPEATFRATGQGIADNTAKLGLSVDTRINPQWDWYLDANWQGQANRLHAFAVNAGVRFSF